MPRGLGGARPECSEPPLAIWVAEQGREVQGASAWRISPRLTGPSRSTAGSSPDKETTVDGAASRAPPSITSREGKTDASAAALVVGGSPWRLALVTASGPVVAHSRRTKRS